MIFKRYSTHNLPWWTTEIDCMRKHVKAARRRVRRTLNLTLRELYRQKYLQIKQKYKEKILDAKISSWKDFLMEINEKKSLKNIYTYAIKKNFMKKDEISGIRLPSGSVTVSL